MKNKITKCVGSAAGGRYREELNLNGTIVTLLKQKSGKLDNAVLDFSGTTFNADILFEIYQLDKYNCYPYVILTDEICEAKEAAKQLNISESVLVFESTTDPDIIDPMMLAMSRSKGFSKGKNAQKSGKLDDILLAYVQSIVDPISDEVQVFEPKGRGTTNGDLQMNLNGVSFFHQENKSISEVLNITERGPMIGGKGLFTTGELYNLFVSFVGFKDSFIDNILKSSPKHIANAYIEFSVADQLLIMEGDVTPFETKKVQYPVDVNDISKGVVEGETLRSFYENVVKQQIS